MKLFHFDADSREVLLNKDWIGLIPELKALLARDKGSKGDYRGDKKLRATREFTFIYFMEDFASPIRDFEPAKKREEALHYAGLEEADIDPLVQAAQECYLRLMLEGSRSLRTLRALWKGMDAMDTHFENIDFAETDKQGKLRYTAGDFANDAIKINKVYDSIKEFEKRVDQDLTQAPTGIRGPNSVLGDREGQKPAEWREDEIAAESQRQAAGASPGGGTMGDMMQQLRDKERQAKTKAAIKLPPASVGNAFESEDV